MFSTYVRFIVYVTIFYYIIYYFAQMGSNELKNKYFLV